ncbi:MAG: DUF4145 domain-containing protein [Terriglobia bacterium]
MQLPYEVEEKIDPFALLQETALFLWKDWPRNMKLSSTSERGFTLNGTCPLCGKEAAFPSVTAPFDEKLQEYTFSEGDRKITVLRCIACREYILGIIKFHFGSRTQSYWWEYEAHYPLGKPNDEVSKDVPEGIRQDFQEALRCRFVNAYNATVEMCRRALEASCIQLGATSDLVLNDMIKWVRDQGKITEPLSDMAHKIKLGGNRAAHPSDRTLTLEDADAVLEFTREYFQHVYVMPAKMAQFDFEKPDKKKP